MNAPARVVDIDDSQEVAVGIEQLGVSAAEVNQQIATAKRFPRSLERFRKELIGSVTLSEEIAGQCLYALPRAGKKIEGPSIRFAEIAMGAWGNCRATARIVAETENFIVAQGIFIDLERNVAVGIEVTRRILDSKGQRFNVDMIGVTGAAASSIALRNAILRGIPRVFVDEAYNAAKATVAGTLATLQDRRNRMLEAFKPYNVTEAQILAAVEKQGLSEIGLQDLVTLGGFLNSIKSEEMDPEEIFGPVPMNAKAAAPRTAPPAATQKPASPSGGESAGADAPKADGGDRGQGQAPPADNNTLAGKWAEEIALALIDCKTSRAIDALEAEYREQIDATTAPERASINQMLADARAKIAAQYDAPAEDADSDFPGARPASK